MYIVYMAGRPPMPKAKNDAANNYVVLCAAPAPFHTPV